MKLLARTALGAPLFLTGFFAAAPAFAQLEPVGEWAPRFHEDQPERIPGPEIGDYLGLPINDAARLRGDSWDASLLTLPEHQCKPHPSDYGVRGPANLRIWKEVDTESQRVIAYHTHISWQSPERTIWMDGRPHPPDYAAHTWQGFSTGKWEGDVLTVTTNHLKIGWIRRNGIPRSDRATVTEHWIRHGDFSPTPSSSPIPSISPSHLSAAQIGGPTRASRSRLIRAKPSSRSTGPWASCQITCPAPTRS